MKLRLVVLLGFALAASQASADTYYVIVGGLGGTEDFDVQFRADVQSLAEAARRTSNDSSQVVLLDGEEATAEAMIAGIKDVASRAGASDSLALFMIGHGSFDGDEYKFNLPGRDITGGEIAELLATVPVGSQLIVNATSASGAVLEDWEGQERTLITATRSGAERNAVRFGRYFAEALSSEEADLDKNSIVTAQEAFDFTSRRVAESYESDGSLATEHPQIVGDSAPRFSAARLQARSMDSPELVALYEELDKVEGEINALRTRREDMSTEDYLAELQTLTVQLALVQRRIDDAGGDSDGRGD